MKSSTIGNMGVAIAPFLGQVDGFSFCNAHAFNRDELLQVMDCLEASRFPPEPFRFWVRVSLCFPSFHRPHSLVLLAFIDEIQPVV
jgi:hypothetical protein